MKNKNLNLCLAAIALNIVLIAVSMVVGHQYSTSIAAQFTMLCTLAIYLGFWFWPVTEGWYKSLLGFSVAQLVTVNMATGFIGLTPGIFFGGLFQFDNITLKLNFLAIVTLTVVWLSYRRTRDPK